MNKSKAGISLIIFIFLLIRGNIICCFISITKFISIKQLFIPYSFILTSTLDKIDPIVLILTGILGPKLLNIGFDVIEPKGI